MLGVETMYYPTCSTYSKGYSHPQPIPNPPPYIRCFHPGDRAPDFVLEGVENLQPKSFRLSDYSGKWVLLFFYGSNFTFV